MFNSLKGTLANSGDLDRTPPTSFEQAFTMFTRPMSISPENKIKVKKIYIYIHPLIDKCIHPIYKARRVHQRREWVIVKVHYALNTEIVRGSYYIPNHTE